MITSSFILVLNLAYFQLSLISGNVVSIAHLLPNDSNKQHEPIVLKICVQDMKERHILPKNLDIE